MVDILPLNGLFYNENKIRNISNVISPPYDVISPPLEKMLYNLDPYNIINLIILTLSQFLVTPWDKHGQRQPTETRAFSPPLCAVDTR